MAAGDKPAWGYVDQPPPSPLMARASTAVFGDSPSGLRVAATLAGAATVLLAALIARELGGAARVQALAAGCAAVSGYVLVVGHMVSTSSFDLVAWGAITGIALRLPRTRDGRWWPLLGLAIGIGLFNKHLVVLLAAVLIAGPRDVLRGRGFLAGLLVVGLPALPTVLWQIDHDWPQLTVADGIREDDGGENRAMFPGRSRTHDRSPGRAQPYARARPHGVPAPRLRLCSSQASARRSTAARRVVDEAA
ncbi:glycosyltransferase family 39 protein [Yinghuangia sp. ASG 101]|uniref:ArnT family glycosyltransferase n=1 Tax=Yinghuangia sp. ASG 101 TaxID=2896848 RepID=UPI001E561AF6|nr:glycosyltransferase family 39 protein [Yinghuangia sp. ASG 101]UGQ10409.1 glycosyltransferase family 39 protein [Yinghuangia sp. ASG 101]